LSIENIIFYIDVKIHCVIAGLVESISEMDYVMVVMWKGVLMNSFWRQLKSFFSGKCLYFDHCDLYQADAFVCNKDSGSWCGACRTFDEIGDRSDHYRK
jgi:hypothetical protein